MNTKEMEKQIKENLVLINEAIAEMRKRGLLPPKEDDNKEKEDDYARD